MIRLQEALGQLALVNADNFSVWDALWFFWTWSYTQWSIAVIATEKTKMLMHWKPLDMGYGI